MWRMAYSSNDTDLREAIALCGAYAIGLGERRAGDFCGGQ